MKRRTNAPQYINQIFTTASSSISINGLDSSSPQFPFPASFSAPTETVEYEPYDSELASRVTALYAQLESLTTSVAQLRRDAPRKAAEGYAAQLAQVMKIEEGEEEEDEEIDEVEDTAETGQANGDQPSEKNEAMDVDAGGTSAKTQSQMQTRSRRRPNPKWNLQVPLGTAEETERWTSGDMADVYENALRTLQRLQGEGDDGEAGIEGNALATTVGKVERAGRAAEVVESM